MKTFTFALLALCLFTINAQNEEAVVVANEGEIAVVTPTETTPEATVSEDVAAAVNEVLEDVLEGEITEVIIAEAPAEAAAANENEVIVITESENAENVVVSNEEAVVVPEQPVEQPPQEVTVTPAETTPTTTDGGAITVEGAQSGSIVAVPLALIAVLGYALA